VKALAPAPDDAVADAMRLMCDEEALELAATPLDEAESAPEAPPGDDPAQPRDA
jgi:hypothetical protein